MAKRALKALPKYPQNIKIRDRDLINPNPDSRYINLPNREGGGTLKFEVVLSIPQKLRCK